MHVYSWRAARHEKFGSPDSVRVIYSCGLQSYSEWICPEHSGFARTKFEQFWRKHRGVNYPATVSEAIDRFGEITMPAMIEIRPSGKWHEVVGRQFIRPQQAAE